MPAAYDDYNRDFRTAIGLGTLAGVVYLAAQADLIFLRPRTPAAPQLSLGAAPHAVVLAVRW